MPEDPPKDDELHRIAREYFARLTSRPLPRSVAPDAPFSIPQPRGLRTRRVFASLGAFVAVAAVLILVIVGIGHVVSTRQTPTATSPPVRATPPPPSPPPGGPVPPELMGDWHNQGSNPQEGTDVIFQGTKFELQTNGGLSFGMVVVNGNEIDFFNADACGIALPGGVGRYRWSLAGGVLHLSPLGADPCGGRTRPLANQSFTKTS